MRKRPPVRADAVVARPAVGPAERVRNVLRIAPLPLVALLAAGRLPIALPILQKKSEPCRLLLPLDLCLDVSPNEGGGLPGSALETVAGSRSRVFGRDRSPGRLSGSLQGLSPSPLSHPGIVSDVPGRLTSGSSHAARVRGDACQRSLRNCPRSGSYLLQPSFPGGEGI